ncbi:serine/arginine repetitive matrix protein 3-like [Onychomys torridus]|uniref:serine/arginine repetitive matrix protein 3-like n=1 Tax=Onychomys torridus TaxID=38674 RepID=UPI00167FCAD9|nr:serine/arginine repetitive matrix protein 3-like [Onychomys torridus]
MMESFWNFLQLESAAGRGSRPSAAREGAPSRPDPRTRLRRSGGVGDLPARSRTSPGRGRRLPSPAAPSGLAGVQARPSRPGRRTGARCRRRPSPSRLVSLSARHLCKSQKPCGLLGRGRGRRRRHRGRPGSWRGSGGKTREPTPPAARPAPAARAEPSKGFSVGGRRGSPLSPAPPHPTSSRNYRASGRRTAGNVLDRFPTSRSSWL